MSDLREALRRLLAAVDGYENETVGFDELCDARIAAAALLAADESRDMQVGMQADKPESAETPPGHTSWRCGCGAWNSSPCWKCGAGPDARYASRAELDALASAPPASNPEERE